MTALCFHTLRWQLQSEGRHAKIQTEIETEAEAEIETKAATRDKSANAL